MAAISLVLHDLGIPVAVADLIVLDYYEFPRNSKQDLIDTLEQRIQSRHPDRCRQVMQLCRSTRYFRQHPELCRVAFNLTLDEVKLAQALYRELGCPKLTKLIPVDELHAFLFLLIEKPGTVATTVQWLLQEHDLGLIIERHCQGPPEPAARAIDKIMTSDNLDLVQVMFPVARNIEGLMLGDTIVEYLEALARTTSIAVYNFLLTELQRHGKEISVHLVLHNCLNIALKALSYPMIKYLLDYIISSLEVDPIQLGVEVLLELDKEYNSRRGLEKRGIITRLIVARCRLRPADLPPEFK